MNNIDEYTRIHGLLIQKLKIKKSKSNIKSTNILDLRALLQVFKYDLLNQETFEERKDTLLIIVDILQETYILNLELTDIVINLRILVQNLTLKNYNNVLMEINKRISEIYFFVLKNIDDNLGPLKEEYSNNLDFLVDKEIIRIYQQKGAKAAAKMIKKKYEPGKYTFSLTTLLEPWKSFITS